MTEENGRPERGGMSDPGPAGPRPTERRPSGDYSGDPETGEVWWGGITAGLCLAIFTSSVAALLMVPVLAVATMPVRPVAAILVMLFIGPSLAWTLLLLYLVIAAAVSAVSALVLYLMADALQRIARGRLPVMAQLLLHSLSAPMVAWLASYGLGYLPPYGLSIPAFLIWALAVSLTMGGVVELLLYRTDPGSNVGSLKAAALQRMNSVVSMVSRGVGTMKNRPWSTAAVSSLALLILVFASGTWSEIRSALIGPKYKVMDSGVGTSRDEIYWLDNRRVIFSGIREPKPETVEDKWTSQVEILIWDTKTNTIEPYRDIPRGLFCYADGRIFYDLRKEERPGMQNPVRIFMAGPLGEETKHEFAIDRALNDRYRFNMLSCRHVKRPAVVPDGGGWMPLKAKHGFLRFVPVKKHYYMNVIFYNGSGPMRLPFNDEETWPTIAQWYALQGGYFMYEPATSIKERSQWQETNCLRAWWLYPGGETESTCVPAGVWVEYGADFIAPIRDGFVFSVLTQPRAIRGLHVFIDGERTRITGGLTEKPVVSPNGCRVAFAHAPSYAALRPGGEGRRTLKMVDICNESVNQKHQ